jgi:hypothetical protein
LTLICRNLLLWGTIKYWVLLSKTKPNNSENAVLNFDDLKKKFAPIRLNDIGLRVTSYLDAPKKIVSNSKNCSPPPFSVKKHLENYKFISSVI